jgi:hypothetical protein
MKTILKSVAASLIMGIVLLGASSWLVADTLRLSIVMGEIIVGVAIYGVVLLLLRTFSSRELLKLKEFVVKGDRSVGK